MFTQLDSLEIVVKSLVFLNIVGSWKQSVLPLDVKGASPPHPPSYFFFFFLGDVEILKHFF